VLDLTYDRAAAIALLDEGQMRWPRRFFSRGRRWPCVDKTDLPEDFPDFSAEMRLLKEDRRQDVEALQTARCRNWRRSRGSARP